MIEVKGLLFLKYSPFQFENFWEICVKFFLPDLEKDAEINDLWFLAIGFLVLFKGCLLVVFLPGLWLAVKWKLKAEDWGLESQNTWQEKIIREVMFNGEAVEGMVWEGAFSCGLAVRNPRSHLMQKLVEFQL